MIQENMVLTNELGLHARPASALTKIALKYKSNVTLQGNGKTVDAKSIIMVMTMGVKGGCPLIVIADGPDELECMAAIQDLVENKFYEE